MACTFWDARSGGAWALKYRDVDGRTRRERTDAKSRTLTRRLLSVRLNEVAEARARGLASVDGLRVAAAPVITFKACCDAFRDHVKAHNAKATVKKYNIILDALVTLWGTRDVRALTSSVIQTHVDGRLLKGYAPATVKCEAAVLRAVLNMARRAGHIDRNPLEGVRLPRVLNTIVRFLNEAEEANLLAHLPEDMQLAVRFAILTGLRDAEHRALCWANIDFVQNVVTIRGKGGKARQIPLCKGALEVLGQITQRTTHPEVFLLDGHPRTKQFGTVAAWTNALKATGLSDVHWHILRHTFCSRLAQRGAGLQTIAELAGHASTQMTQRYAHLTSDNRSQAVALLDLMPSGAQGGTQAENAVAEGVEESSQVLDGTTGMPTACVKVCGTRRSRDGNAP